MHKQEITEGTLVCVCVDGRPHINTTVVEFPIRHGYKQGDAYAILEGIEEPYPIKNLLPFNRGYSNCDDLLTSEEWHKQQFAMYKIVDPDGWDRSNYSYSWYIERISRKEFECRLSGSTVHALKIFKK
jgi:hypothetical protein